MTNQGPLSGFRVLDFTQMMAGPFATQVLADLGADVIKVEKPGEGEWERSLASMGEYFSGQSVFFLAMNRGKRSLAVDLKRAEGIEVIRRLIPSVDVVMSNFKPGTMERLGLGYESVAALNPDIVYHSSSGFGQFGPYSNRPGQDLLLQAVSGLAAQSGRAGSPPTPTAHSLVDSATALFNVIAILAALLGRERGRPVGEAHVDMLSAAISIQCQELAAHTNLGQEFERSPAGVGAPWSAAPYGIYATSDGYIAIAMGDIAVVAAALAVPNIEELVRLDPFADRDELQTRIASSVQRWTRDEAVDLLLAVGAWAAPVLDFDEVVNHPQARANGSFVTLVHSSYGRFQASALPIRYSQFEPTYEIAAPLVGEHSRAILTSFGFTETEIDGLVESGVVDAGAAS